MRIKDIATTFTISKNANWNCPTCGASLVLKEGGLNDFATSQTQFMSSKAYHHEMEHEYVFSCFFNCVNAECNEFVSCSGAIYHDVDVKEDTYGNVEQIYPRYYFPKYFYPNLKFFKVSKSVPENILIRINKSFEMFFCNYNAALNEMRGVVEILLELWGVPQKNPNGKFVNLDNRIKTIPSTLEKYKSHLMAAKWLGNAGSHSGSELKKNDVIDAYEIINYILSEVYDSYHTKVDTITQEINNKKGPR